RVTSSASYARAASRIARALVRAWREDLGQLARGIDGRGEPDAVRALDCASWGAVLLEAVDERAHAEAALASAEGAYATRDPRSGARGHRAHAEGPVLEDPVLAQRLGP